jgi:NAD-dependent dihydropyrimidine dehydrogenase PreA subunit
MSSIIGWIIAYWCRWLPHSAPTGLFKIGEPDENSPVIVTANFSLTIKRVKRALRGRNLWLLVANSDGINVWCAADGSIFTENRVIDAIKISGLSEAVSHRRVILPALSAPGIDRKAIKEETGFSARFGPVYAKDIPEYLDGGMKKTEAMRRFNFDIKHRLDMFWPMNFPIYFIVALVLAIFFREHLLGFTALFWFAVAFLYVFINVIPGKTGWGQAFISATLFVLAWAGLDWYLSGDPLVHWGWFIAAYVIFFAGGFDLAGTASARKSDAELLMHRLGFSSFGSLFSEKDLGEIALDRDKCKGCGTCREICPVGVYGDLDPDKKTTFSDRDACFACGACVKQCPEGALRLGSF